MSPSGSDSPSGRAEWFATTHWSVVRAAKSVDSEQALGALEKLCQAYWRPLYAYIRREGYDIPDAQDLTQEFFARLLEKDYLAHLQHERGKFRSFLLTFLKHFLSDERAKTATQKRGGRIAFISLDGLLVDDSELIEPASGLSPEQLFERRWAETVLEQAVQRLRAEYIASGKSALFEQLKDLQLGSHGTSSYAETGARIGMTETAIKSAVFRLRRRHREILREEIAHTVGRRDEIDSEIRYLLSVLGR